MGTVWMAQQQEPAKRLVALKLIKVGMDSKQIITRFEAERQALALYELLTGSTVWKKESSMAAPGRVVTIFTVIDFGR
jgi:hypothetical protein